MNISRFKPIIFIIIILIASIILSKYFNYSESDIINYQFILTSIIGLFSVSLAIDAIFFTVLDRFKESVADKLKFINDTNAILLEMAQNSFGLFILIVLLFIGAVFENLLNSINCIDCTAVILLFSLFMSLLITFDITFSINILIKKINIASDVSEKNFGLTQDERKLVEAYRILDIKHSNELLEYIKTLIVKQKIDK